MKFTIITPVRNRKQYSEETIKSVINQKKIDLDDIEYIIVDGLSTDGTQEIIKNYQSKIPSIKLISEKDNSMYEALSKGLKIATGEIISYINAGDLYNPNALNIVRKVFLQNKSMCWVTGGKYIYNENSETIKTTIPYKYRSSLIRTGVYGRYLPYIQQESTFWKSDLNKLIDYDQLSQLTFAGDYFLWFQFSKKFEINIIQSHLGGFKIHEDQLSSKVLKNNLTYKKEMSFFTKTVGLKEIFLIILDSIPWGIMRYSNDFFGYIAKHLIYDTESEIYKISKNKDEIIYCWACDIGTNRGEGRLGQKFLINEFDDSSNFYIKTLDKKIFSNKENFQKKLPVEKKINLNIIESYFAPIFGIFWLWYKYLSGKKICYINFMPLWNTFLIVFLPPKTILGPITGSIYNGKVFNIKTFLRKYLVPILYSINSHLIILRKRNLILSTNLLKKYFKNKNNLKLKYNYILRDIKLKDYNNSKKIDLAIYYRKYDTKNNIFFSKIIEYFSNQKKYNFVYFGNQCQNFKENFKGHIENKEVDSILHNTKFSIISEENFQSLFSLECIINHVNLFYDPSKMDKNHLTINNDKLLNIDYDNINLSIEKIENYIDNFNKLNKPFEKKDFNN